MPLAPKKLIEIVLVRQAGTLDSEAVAVVDHHIRTLLAPFHLGRRMSHKLVLRDGIMSMTFLLKCSGQLGLDPETGSSSSPEQEFRREAQAIQAFLQERLEVLYEDASSFRATPYDVSAAVERAQARGILAALCWRQGEDPSGRATVAYPHGDVEEFRLSAVPGRVLVPDPIDVAFRVTAVGVSHAEIRQARTAREGGRRLPRRAAVHWDSRVQPAVSQAFFRLMHSSTVITLPLNVVIKPTGTVDVYHLTPEAAAFLGQAEKELDASVLS